MDRVHLLPMELPPATSISPNHNVRSGKMSFIRRLGLGCIVLAVLGLLYVPAYHSAQGPLGIGETSSTGSSGLSRYLEPVAHLHGWAYNTSRNVNYYVHPQNNTTILSPDDYCSLPAPYLLIVVCTAPDHQKQRTAIRNTWAGDGELGLLNSTVVKVLFLLGESDNETLNNSILDEHHEYGDIIQERFIDAYNNLTLKSVMMLKWVTTYCPQATYLMKTDDDMYVNVENLVSSLRARPQVEGTLMGSLICFAKPISDPKNKWYTPKYMFAEKTYPNYLSGTGYVMSLDVAFKLYESALSVPLLHLEDVYITGLCARSAKVRPINHPGFSYVQRKLDFCVLKDAITAHRVDVNSMHAIWNKLRNNNVTCVEKKPTPMSRHGRNIGGYFMVKRRVVNRCV